MEEILVSVSCLAYNHENYIADALDSFLMQKTNFKFEILIHDDFSTDATKKIIQEYTSLYPEIIKPLYQKENQYSKGIKVSAFNNKRAKGKYIAICEGDDYWTDPNKLQKQVDILEQNPEYSLIVHSADIVDGKTKKVNSKARPAFFDKIFLTDEIIEGGGSLFATNSMIYRRKYEENLPPFYFNAPIGDYPLAIHLSLMGKIYYLDDVMSAYRKNSIGSWSIKTIGNNNKLAENLSEVNLMLQEIDKYTDFKYQESINKRILKNKYQILLLQKRYNEIKENDMKLFYDSLTKKEKFKIFIKQYFPTIYDMLLLFKKYISK